MDLSALLSGIRDELPDLSGLSDSPSFPSSAQPVPAGPGGIGASPKFEVSANSAASMPSTGDYMSKVGGASDVPVAEMYGKGGGGSTVGAVSRNAVREARANGHSDEDIARYLSAQVAPGRYEDAIGQGHSSQQIIDYFSPPDLRDKLAPVDAFMRGVANTIPFHAADRLENAFSSPEDIAMRKSEAGQHPIASTTGTVSGIVGQGAALSALGGPWWAQAARFGVQGGANAASTGIDKNEDLSKILGRTVAGTAVGAAVPAAISGVGAVARPLVEAVSTGAVKTRMARELIEREAKASGETFEQAAARLGQTITAGAQSPIEGVNRTLSTAAPENATLAQAQNSLAATREGAGQKIMERHGANQEAILEHIRGQNPGDATIANAQQKLDAEAEKMYDAARANYEKVTPPVEKEKHALQFTGLAEKNDIIQSAATKVAADLHNEEALNHVAKARAMQAAGAGAPAVGGQQEFSSQLIHQKMQANPKLSFEQAAAEVADQQKLGISDSAAELAGWEPLKPGHGSPVDIMHRTRRYIDQTIKYEPGNPLNEQRKMARNAVDAQLRHMSPEFKAADETFAKNSTELAQLTAAKNVSEAAAPPYAQNAQQRRVANLAENEVFKKGPLRGKPALAADVKAEFDKVVAELGRQQQSGALGNGPGSATAGRLKEAMGYGLKDAAPIMIGDMLAGGHVGASVYVAKRMFNALRSGREVEAAKDLFLNPHSTGELFQKLSAQEQSNVMNAVKGVMASGATAPIVQDQLLNLWPEQ